MSSQTGNQTEQQQTDAEKTAPPGYRITHHPCCYNCLHFDIHWCSHGDDDTCAKHGHCKVEPTGLCDSFELCVETCGVSDQ